MFAMFVAAIPILVVIIALVALVMVAKTHWGFNLSQTTKCPKCRSTLPVIRKPADAHEAMWGGWTCQTCHTEVDRRGRVRAS